MLHDENEHLMEDDQQNSFLYWGPPISQEWKSLNIDQKTMGISNVPCKPSGIAIILKEPGKAKGDNVTKMFPEKGGIGKAGYEAPYDSLNVAYNHEWWTCLGDEKKKSTHRDNCCESDTDKDKYDKNCKQYRDYFRNICSLISSDVDSTSKDLTFITNIYLANLYYPPTHEVTGSSTVSDKYKKIKGTDKVTRFLSLMNWMKKDSVKKNNELKYVFVQKDLYELLQSKKCQKGLQASESYPCIAYKNGNQNAFYSKKLGMWIISTYHPIQWDPKYQLNRPESQKNIKKIDDNSKNWLYDSLSHTKN